jgi:RNA-binding protein PNO1
MSKKKARTAGTASSQLQVDGDDEMASEAIPSSKLDHTAEDDDLMIDVDHTSPLESSSAPSFQALPVSAARSVLKSETRRIPIPPHRMTPIKKDWINIFSPLTEILGLQVRMNVQRRCVEIRVRICISLGEFVLITSLQTSKATKEIGALQKGADFVKAYALGFDVNASIEFLCLLHSSKLGFTGRDSTFTNGRSLPRFIRDQRCKNASWRSS